MVFQEEVKFYQINPDPIVTGNPKDKVIIHVNQHHIKKNSKENTNLPVFCVRHGNNVKYAWNVVKTGPSILESHITDPLSCGARAYDVTYNTVILLDENGIPFDGVEYKDL